MFLFNTIFPLLALGLLIFYFQFQEKLKTTMKTLEEDRKHKENIKEEFEESAKHIKVSNLIISTSMLMLSKG